QATVKMDAARLEALQLKLRQNRLQSPIAGVVSEPRAHDGGFVRQGDPLLTIVSVTEPKVEFDVAASDYPKLKAADTLVFRTPIFRESFRGRIVFISPAGDLRLGTFRAKAVLEDPDHRLRAGMRGQVQVRAE